MSTAATGGALSVWPVFRIDFNQAHSVDTVWAVLTSFEVSMWGLAPGVEVIVEDLDDPTLRCYATVTSISTGWIVEFALGLDAR